MWRRFASGIADRSGSAEMKLVHKAPSTILVFVAREGNPGGGGDPEPRHL